MSKSDRIDVYLVAGGKYHNIDHARLEMLKLLAEQPRIKVLVGADYSDIDAICASDFLITYTCDVVPDAAQTRAPGGLHARWRKVVRPARHQFHPAISWRRTPTAIPGWTAPRTTCPSWKYWAASSCRTHPSTNTKCWHRTGSPAGERHSRLHRWMTNSTCASFTANTRPCCTPTGPSRW